MLLLLSLLLACEEKDANNKIYFDADSDGFTAETDCNDDDASIHPAADEICDGIDNNCDELIDDDAVDKLSFYLDIDGDGFGGSEGAGQACELPEGFVDRSDDCNDDDASIHPDAEEICDGIDNDCDDLTDDADNNVNVEDGVVYYTDADGDGFGAEFSARVACVMPENAAEVSDDCNDGDALIHPDAEEVCDGIDNNCNNIIDEQLDGLTQCDECTDTALPMATGELFSGVNPIGDEATLECFSGGDDTISRWVAPASGVYTISSFADAMALWQDCGETSLECSSLGSISREFARGETVQIVLEGRDLNLEIWGEEEYHCDDGYDDDNDGFKDCDDEEDCWFDSLCGASLCPNFDLVDPINFEVSNGFDIVQTTLFGSDNDEEASCFSTGNEDLSYWYQAESNGCAEIYAYSNDFDVHLAVYDSCGGNELDCNAGSAQAMELFETSYGSHVRLQLTEGESYIIIVDGLPASVDEQFMLGIDHFEDYDCDGSPLNE